VRLPPTYLARGLLPAPHHLGPGGSLLQTSHRLQKRFLLCVPTRATQATASEEKQPRRRPRSKAR